MLGRTTGRQYSGREISAMLTHAGFAGIKIKPTFGFMSIVTGRKRQMRCLQKGSAARGVADE